MQRIKDFIIWCKILRAEGHTKWWLTMPGPEYIWYAWSNSRTHHHGMDERGERGSYKKNTPGGS